MVRFVQPQPTQLRPRVKMLPLLLGHWGIFYSIIYLQPNSLIKIIYSRILYWHSFIILHFQDSPKSPHSPNCRLNINFQNFILTIVKIFIKILATEASNHTYLVLRAPRKKLLLANTHAKYYTRWDLWKKKRGALQLLSFPMNTWTSAIFTCQHFNKLQHL